MNYFLFTKCKAGPILQFIYSYGSGICRDTFKSEFFPLSLQIFPSYFERRQKIFRPLICVRTEACLLYKIRFFYFFFCIVSPPGSFTIMFHTWILSFVISVLMIFLGTEPFWSYNFIFLHVNKSEIYIFILISLISSRSKCFLDISNRISHISHCMPKMEFVRFPPKLFHLSHIQNCLMPYLFLQFPKLDGGSKAPSTCLSPWLSLVSFMTYNLVT